MKAVMLSKKKVDDLFHHVFGGFKSSYEGIEQARDCNAIKTDQEELELLRKNSQRLIDRIREWQIINNITCIFFALMFALMQVNGDQLELRRPGRTRSGRRQEVERVGG